jgi:hypothetical protein
MKPTDILAPDYFHKLVDCQSACPAHTPVPHYIRLIAEGRPAEAYMVNWEANVSPAFSVAPATGPVSRRAAAAGRNGSRWRSAG